jgi:ornithine--oxo-acid transaminase
VLPPAGFLRAARELADERNVLLILDEIQSGLGRTGEWFAYMHEGIRPDGVIVGKALGGGLLPVSAFVAINAVMDLLEPGSHGSTFGGNPLAARVGREALAVIEEERLVERSANQHASAISTAQRVVAADSCRARARAMGRRRAGRERVGARGC